METEKTNSLLTILKSYGERVDRHVNELTVLRVVVQKVQVFMSIENPEWDICQHEFEQNDLPVGFPVRCLKCNAKPEAVDILTLCREVSKGVVR